MEGDKEGRMIWLGGLLIWKEEEFTEGRSRFEGIWDGGTLVSFLSLKPMPWKEGELFFMKSMEGFSVVRPGGGTF